jgi:hypothetical protein
MWTYLSEGGDGSLSEGDGQFLAWVHYEGPLLPGMLCQGLQKTGKA